MDPAEPFAEGLDVEPGELADAAADAVDRYVASVVLALAPGAAERSAVRERARAMGLERLGRYLTRSQGASVGHARTEPPAWSDGAAAPTTPARVLLVDDDALVRTGLQRLLERLGYAVTATASGVGALAHLEADPRAFDLVLTDVEMPGMSGIELGQFVRRLRSDLPIVFATGFRAEPGGVVPPKSDVLWKPFAAADLVAMLGRVLARAKSKRGEPRSPR